MEMQGNKLFVTNISYSVGVDQLKDLFSQFGEVVQANLIEGRGFGFITFASNELANTAKEELNGKEFMGRPLRVDFARKRKPAHNNNRGGGGGGHYH